MGVKDLWQLLAPVCERKSLWELQDKTVAIDLSGWVCDSQNVAEYSTQPNMHLRNLFFRTSCLLLLGARPVFVLEGDAPDIKLAVMSQRNASRGLTQASFKKNTGKRTRYKGIQKKCQEMLKSMGVHCVQSIGEAEALCAVLNAEGMVDGCISQDSDCFLYGGRVVYRNFTISASSGGGGGPGFSIDMYRMEQVEKLLGLSRTRLIGLSLLCGCDYNQGGVLGVGKETAAKFLATLSDAEVFPRFVRWRKDPFFDQLEKERSCGVCDRCCHLGKKKLHDKNGCDLCGTTKSCHVNHDPSVFINRDPEEQKVLVMELNIRKKALQDEKFPSQDVIDEFSCAREVPESLPIQWSQPNLVGFMKLAEKHLKWDECYSLEKFLPVLTRWLILQRKSTSKCPIYPESILKTRVLKGVASYEVKWADREGLFEALLTEENSNACLTIEPRELFERAFPDIVLEFSEREAAKKMSKQKGKSKSTKSAKAAHVSHKCTNCGKNLPSKTQKCMCHFVTTLSKDEESSPTTLEGLLDSLTLNSERKGPPKTKSESSNVIKNSENSNKVLQNVRKDEDKIKGGKSGPFSAPVPAVAVLKNTTKFSFEDFLGGEGWTVEDFAIEDEGDLSDIVQSITGKNCNSRASSELETCVTPCQKMNTNKPPTVECGSPELPRKHAREDSSDEEAPYTPLIERVRKIQGNKGHDRRTSTVAALKLRRLSESFNAFCLGENATSSPLSDSVEGSRFPDPDAVPDVTFSLGITNLLESSK